jgi:hypothetical protein
MSYLRAQQGKRYSNGFLVFQEQAPANLVDIHSRLLNQTWVPEPYRRFVIYEPKQRIIGAPSFADRIVHHSLCSVIEPIMDSTFLPWTFACRRGKGTHAGVTYVQSQMRKRAYTHFLKTDFKSFFPSIDTDILHEQYEKKISCQPTLKLLRKIIQPGSKGVPIGALTSQLSANVYGNMLDQYLHHQLKVPFARYMDDVIVLGYDMMKLREVKNSIEQFASEEMQLSLSHWSVAPVSRGINFIGYRIWSGHKLLRKDSVTGAKKKIRTMTEREDSEALLRFIGSWSGHVNKADTYNLKIWLDKQHELTKILKSERLKKRPNREQLFESMFDSM